MNVKLNPQLKAKLEGVISRGVKESEIDENGHLIFTLTDNSTVDLGKVVGEDGEPGADGKSAYESAQDGGYTGTEAQFNSDLAKVSEKKALVFTLSSMTDYETAKAIYDFKKSGGCPIVQYNSGYYIFYVRTLPEGEYNDHYCRIKQVDINPYISNSTTSISNDDAITFVIRRDTETVRYISYARANSVRVLDANRNYSEPYTPLYPGSPATKKYVDDSVGGKYEKPQTGIPKTDLASTVQESLEKADSALQTVPSTYRTAEAQDLIDAGKQDAISDLSTIRSGAAAGATALQQVPTASDDTLGGIKVGSDFDIGDDGTLSLYKALTLSASVSPSVAEIGSTIDDVTVSWTVNKTPVSQSVEGVDVPVSDRSKALHDLGITANRTFAVTAADARMSLTRNPGITFYRYVYSKVGSSDAAPTQASECVKQADLSTFGNNGAEFSYSAGTTLWLLTTKANAQIETNVLGQWADVTTINAGTVEFTQANGAVATYYAYNTGVFGGTGSAKYRIR